MFPDARLPTSLRGTVASRVCIWVRGLGSGVRFAAFIRGQVHRHNGAQVQGRSRGRANGRTRA